jgi:hypothetical protein
VVPEDRRGLCSDSGSEPVTAAALRKPIRAANRGARANPQPARQTALPIRETDRYVSCVISAVEPKDRPVQTPRPKASPRWLFKVVDVVSGRTVLEDADAHTTVNTLTSVESIFDVWIFVWIPDVATWRQLTPGEHRILWNFRGR